MRPSLATNRVPHISLLRCGIAATALLIASPRESRAQWEIQSSPTTSDLRGIHSLGNGIAWASGSDGAVLRTTDDGVHWTLCPTPPNAEHLDFRGIQAFDASTAIVMSSGKGSLSRLYKTTNACQTWKLVVTNEEPKGFWDSLRMFTPQDGFLAGDPVNGILYFAENTSYWNNFLDRGEDRLWKSAPGETAFAASNSSLSLGAFGEKAGEVREVWFGTGGVAGSRVFHYKTLQRRRTRTRKLGCFSRRCVPKE